MHAFICFFLFWRKMKYLRPNFEFKGLLYDKNSFFGHRFELTWWMSFAFICIKFNLVLEAIIILKWNFTNLSVMLVISSIKWFWLTRKKGMHPQKKHCKKVKMFKQNCKHEIVKKSYKSVSRINDFLETVHQNQEFYKW